MAIRRSKLEVRLLDIRQDPDVVEFVLTAIYTAAQALNPDLVPTDCPVTVPYALIAAIGNIPRIRTLIQSGSLYRNIQALGPKSERLLCWASAQYRGFLFSVPSGPHHIPGLPIGTKQFTLADAGHVLERKFKAEEAQNHKKVYFHGTSFDRFYAILTNGLRVLSHDQWLQRHGAIHGSGIYLTNSPSEALNYAQKPRIKVPERSRDMLWYNHRILLCLESATTFKSVASPRNGVNYFVTTDESSVILRYIFLLPPGQSILVNEQSIVARILSSVLSLRGNR